MTQAGEHRSPPAQDDVAGRRSAPDDVLRDLGPRRRAVLLAALFLVTFSFVGTTRPGEGLDPSWQLALSLAHVQDLRFGSDLVFTYGPLGFLDEPTTVFMSGAVLALAWSVLTTLAFVWLLLRAALRWLPLGPAIALTGLVGLTMRVGVAELGGLVVVLYALELSAAPSRFWRRPQAAIALLGGVTAILLLTKFSVGVHAGAVTAIVCLATPAAGRLQRAGAAASSFLVSLIALWVLAGQRPGDLLRWIRSSLDVASGYSAAMFRPVQGRLLIAIVILLVASMGVVLWRAALRARDRWPYGLAPLLILAWTCWMYSKAGLVRFGPGHMHITAAAVATVLVAMAPPRRREGKWSRAPLALAALVGLVPVLLVDGSRTSAPVAVVSARARSLGSAVTLVHEAVDPGLRVRRLDQTAEDLRRRYGIEQVRDDLPETLHAAPWSVSAVWALGRTWTPPPVFQDYVAYTPALDELNRAFLAGPDAPEGILAANVSIDRRVPFWDAPATQLEVVCRYGEAGLVGVFPLLLRHEDRCGGATPAASVVVERGEELVVPPPRRSDTIVVAEIRYPTTTSARLLAAVLQPFRADRVRVERVGVPAGPGANRLLVATAGGPLLIRVPTIEERPLHRGGIDIRTLRFPDAPGAVEVRFSEIPIDG